MPVILPMKNRTPVTLAPSKIVCIGLNYLDHIKESQSVNVQNFTNEVPQEPVLFPKTPNVLTAPDAPIILPAFVREYAFDEQRTDYEGELAVIINKQCKNLREDEVMAHILGFTCFNDVSQRNLQRNDKSGWYRGKSLDSFGPIGPVIVAPEDIGDVQNLAIETRLNGKVVQQANTSQMIFTVIELVAYISRNFTLEAGDIISTGTPSGVGSVKEGDLVEVEIENIGILKNPVKDER